MHTVHYASSRLEVWRWYWRAWAKPNGLWLFHVAIAFILAVSFTGVGLGRSFDVSQFAKACVFSTALCLILLPLWPQLRFKSSTRSLTIGPEGLITRIGEISGSRTWREISSIESDGEEVVIVGKNRNAFIIPSRAFQSAAARQEFLRDARL